ncbi:MAG TPA: helix-turn-helix domain-containing protein [Candidatus Saccharimonadales bacterium]|nr:helix-turn-helix domain-containing protein [Candidatus Saccharimonadales bacterium]
MADNNDTTLRRLKSLNLSSDEARIYLELLKGPATHLKLARSTGINRSKVYRVAEQLERRSLVNVRSDDRGTFLIASDPATLEVELVTEEENIKSKRAAFETLLPMLQLIKNNDVSSFIVHTYEGEEGFKQMMWHELKTKEENLMFGRGSLNDIIENKRWIAQQRERMIQANYKVRELINPGETKEIFTVDSHYQYREIPRDVLPLDNQMVTYNDTVAIYHWRHQQKVGIEIVNVSFAETVRSMFNHYWDVAGEATP